MGLKVKEYLWPSWCFEAGTESLARSDSSLSLGMEFGDMSGVFRKSVGLVGGGVSVLG